MVYDQNLFSFQAKIQFRAENEDFYNNETFGSSENLSQESAEEERRRRGKISFLFFLLLCGFISGCIFGFHGSVTQTVNVPNWSYIANVNPSIQIHLSWWERNSSKLFRGSKIKFLMSIKRTWTQKLACFWRLIEIVRGLWTNTMSQRNLWPLKLKLATLLVML